MLQNYARKYRISIDKLNFKFEYLDSIAAENIQCKPEDGCYISGLYIEGAQWNKIIHCIDDAKPKELFSDLPLIHILPSQNVHLDE